MSYRIYNWLDISHRFDEAILIGNGASISINDSFDYGSLKEHAIENGLLTENVRKLFAFFKTNDFELILRLVWQANKVNDALDIKDKTTKVAYEHVRDSLIRTVQSVHPEYFEVEEQFPDIAEFLSSFRTVLSLNYDLTLYWVVMYANRIPNGHSFKDCMVHGKFSEDWRRFSRPIGHRDQKNTLIFYPHGSLILARNILEQEVKLDARLGNDLLRSILNSWESEEFVPLFVSEGTSEQKVGSIQNSHYLNTVYREVLPYIGSSLVIYGWGVCENDIHILKRLGSSRFSRLNRIAVSVFNHEQSYCRKVAEMIATYVGRRIEVIFFDCKSKGCWNNPA